MNRSCIGAVPHRVARLIVLPINEEVVQRAFQKGHALLDDE